ncbi:MAG: TonB-dependent receptor, partial [Chlorobi bacterium]|nr:TonB-dependent receptor [Chlorobiota bacterium]
EDYIQYGGEDGEPNIKYNSDWGYYNGDVYTWRRNFYHKPIASLNWEWDINNKSKLSTVLYGSWGRGGGTGGIGAINGSAYYYGTFRGDDGLVRFDDIATWNSGGSVPDFGADRTDSSPYTNDRYTGISRRASMNSHDWYGVITNYHNDINENLSFDFGADLRTYSGYHYRVVNDVLGADQYYDNRDINNPDRIILPADFVEADPSWNPFENITDQEKIEYYNQGNVRWEGVFGQVEYKTDKYSAFVQGGFSNQDFQRIDYFNLPRDVDGDGTVEPQESDWVSMTGGNIKGGVNYNINEQHNVFVNAGYYSKQPLFRSVFPNYTDNNTNSNLTNETVIGVEAGYGFKTRNWNIKLNLYNTSWKDRYAQFTAYRDIDGDGTDDRLTARVFDGIEEVHRGVELEARGNYGKLKVFGMISAGDWSYTNNATATLYDYNEANVGDLTLFLDDVKVGDAAQFTSRIGANYNIIEGLYIDANYFYADKLYAYFDATSFSDPNGRNEALELPSYGLVDASLTYKYKFKKGNKLTARFTVNNLFDKTYISESDTNYFPGDRGNDETWDGINTSNRVFFGWGRSWNISLRYTF